MTLSRQPHAEVLVWLEGIDFLETTTTVTQGIPRKILLQTCFPELTGAASATSLFLFTSGDVIN